MVKLPPSPLLSAHLTSLNEITTLLRLKCYHLFHIVFEAKGNISVTARHKYVIAS